MGIEDRRDLLFRHQGNIAGQGENAHRPFARQHGRGVADGGALTAVLVFAEHPGAALQGDLRRHAVARHDDDTGQPTGL